ncbi:MAG: carbonic anhydrase family protein [Polyangiaceae bacterium]
MSRFPAVMRRMPALALLLLTSGCQKLFGSDAAASSATASPSESSASETASRPAGSSSAASAGHGEKGAKKGEHKDHPWTYSGDKGPAHWGELDPKWDACRAGKAQSPVDLPNRPDFPHVAPKETVKASDETLTIDYVDVPLRVQNNGHTIQVANDGDSYILVGANRYDLVQFHFHSPSEHTLGGERFPLEGHFVHKSEDGQLAVVGAFFTLGEAGPELAELWRKAPKEETEEPIATPKKVLDVSSIVSTKEGYFSYAGSLTTPPCSEGVRWFVLKHVSTVDKKTVDAFREWFDGRTNRPIQPLGDRMVRFASR